MTPPGGSDIQAMPAIRVLLVGCSDEDARWVLSYGFHDGHALVSLRTSQTERKAGDVMREIVKGIGTGGGHATAAGAQLPLPEGEQTTRRALVRKLRDRFLTRTGGKARGRRVVRS